MSVKKFRFVSPGIFINEIDQSQLPTEPARMGPVIIGQSERGPVFRPITVSSFAEFVETFGNPIPGGEVNDVWRNGNYNGPTYAAYAAQAYLKHSNPVTFVRLAGAHHDNNSTPLATSIGGHGTAGWQTANDAASDLGGAYGLFVIPSASIENGGSETNARTGSLAAIWYVNNGSMILSGTLRGTHTGSVPISLSGSSVMIGNTDKWTWKAVIRNADSGSVVETAFSFDPNSENYIRRAFNTNPQLVNTDIYSQGTTNYWLGESFDRSVQDIIPEGSSSANEAWGVLLQLASGSTEYCIHNKEHLSSETGWFVSQDTSADPAGLDLMDQQRAKRLFKLISLDTEWSQNNIKISIEDIRPAKNEKTWATFTVTIRTLDDNDRNKKILEKFSNCNLNAGSPNYIARKIGDRQFTYDKANKQLKIAGNYENKSRYVRVKTNEAVYSQDLMPFGCYGPPRYKGFTFTSGSAGGVGAGTVVGTPPQRTFVAAGSDMSVPAIVGLRRQLVADGASSIADYTGLQTSDLEAGEIWTGWNGINEIDIAVASRQLYTGSMRFPALALRSKATNGKIVDQSKAYWGVDTTRFSTNDDDIRFDPCVRDYLKTLPDQTTQDTVDFHLTDANDNAECSFLFTLDDLVENSDGIVVYTSGSRSLSGTLTPTTDSITAKSGSNFLLTASTMGHDKFTTVLYGGFDGLDIREKNPFNNTRALDDSDEKASYAFFSVTKALEIVKDAERVESNLMAMPGIINEDLTARLVRIAEERSDTLAIIDIGHDFTPAGENTSSDMTNQGDVDNAVRTMKDRKIDSSYGAAYYPWVQIQDTASRRVLWAPPSIVALGAMAYSESVRDVWFAPAGFNRGGLTSAGAGGVPVIGVNQLLTSKQRDKLYEVNVNPIASFPAEGIVVFGQKTLQLTPSALDRINVRRLLIFLKKEISTIASTTLFEPNLEVTWAAFRAKADALLSSVKSRLGLADYKLVLDKSTTTPDLVDRNIMYAKVFLKPARAIEFIALDFIITRSGASFED